MANSQQKGTQTTLKNHVLFLKTKASGVYAPGDRCDTYLGLKFGEGNFTWNMTKNQEYMLDRGVLDDVRKGDEAPLEVSFQGKFTFTKTNGDENYTVHEILDGHDFGDPDANPIFVGAVENWLATYGCPPYAAELELHNNPAMDCPNTSAHGEATLFRYFRTDSINVDINGGTIDVSGKCHVLRPIPKRIDASGGSGGSFGYVKAVDAEPLDLNDAAFWPDDPREEI